MKKRILCLVLSMALCLGCLTGVASASTSTVTRGTAEYTALENFLAQLGWWRGSSSYDSEKAATNSPVEYGAKNILEAMLTAGSGYCYNDTLYPGEAREELWYEKDPLGKWESHWKTNAEKVDWILQNIFNCSDSAIATLKSSVLSGSQTIYARGGYYYSQIGGVGGGYTASITDIQPSGGKYLVTYNLKSMYETTSQPRYAVVEQKNIGGKNYWSLYYNTALQAGQNPVKTGGFFDVKSDAYYCGPVLWAVERGITAGTGLTTFSPDATCTKGQILTFLWRAKGQPEPSIANPFRDITSSDYYYKAAVWAAEHGLVSGTAFNAAEPCTRAMTATYLWKLAGSPPAAGSSFSDVPASADYAEAVAWAVSQGITSGTGNNQFSPSATCTRGQIVTFLYRYIVEALPQSSSSSTPATSDTAWSAAYKDFVLSTKFMDSSYPYDCDSEPWGAEVANSISLYDMDADGVPELFITNGFGGKIVMRTYTYTNGRIEYIGNAPIGFCFYSPQSEFTGVWSSVSFDGLFYTYYYYKDGNQIKNALVKTDDGLGGNVVRVSGYTGLFEASDISKMPYLEKQTVDEIWIMGWDNFVSGSAK